MLNMLKKVRDNVVQSARDEVIRRLRTRHEYLNVKPLAGLFNNACFRNAVQFVRDNPSKDTKIIECMFVDANYPILHYVILMDGEYLEVTNGWESKIYEYYYIRTINPLDYDRIHSEFTRSQSSWLDEFIPMWKQRLLGIKVLV